MVSSFPRLSPPPLSLTCFHRRANRFICIFWFCRSDCPAYFESEPEIKVEKIEKIRQTGRTHHDED